MGKGALPSVLACLIVAAAFGATLLGRQDDAVATVAKAVAIVGLLALTAAIGWRRRSPGD
jgi:MYXO-CTERM domain-containing protein